MNTELGRPTGIPPGSTDLTLPPTHPTSTSTTSSPNLHSPISTTRSLYPHLSGQLAGPSPWNDIHA